MSETQPTRADALRLAADTLEQAHRAGEEIAVSWWWLRDQAERLSPHSAHSGGPIAKADQWDPAALRGCPTETERRGAERGWDEAAQALAWCLNNGPVDSAARYVAKHNPYRRSAPPPRD